MTTRLHLERHDPRRRAWLFLLSFDLGCVDLEEIEHRADQLLSVSAHPGIQARLIRPGDPMGLLYWSPAEGWHRPQEVAA